MNEVSLEIELSIEDQKILNTPVALYEYLKKIYGIPGSEKINPYESISKKVELSLIGLQSKTSSQTIWSAHLEENKQESNIDPNAQRLIFGVTWPSNGHMWSRVFEVEAQVQQHRDSAPFARCRYEPTANNLFEKEHIDLFIPVFEFFKILNNFIKQY
ncbi:MAG TPA: hypothetical protein VL576_01630 [Candidatus Paceibacterota bacterium]|jgi:hypothetical protein|nr:hypothetical protein [Candidatus Paceibacterota bacterium]